MNSKKTGTITQGGILKSKMADMEAAQWTLKKKDWNDNSLYVALWLDEAKVPATGGSHVCLKCERHSTVAYKEIIHFWKHNCLRTRNDKPVCVRPVRRNSSEENGAKKMDWKDELFAKLWQKSKTTNVGNPV